MPDQKRNAIINARDIERQIMRLIRIFSKKEMKDKLIKEFGSSKQANDID
jgi:vacuolar-type H+-ATPase subunit I/STV1